MPKTLVNFLIEEAELDRFDSVVSMLGRTRTSVLIEMMKMFCTEQVEAVEQRNRKLEQLNQALTQQHMLQAQADHSLLRNRPVWREENDYTPPSLFMTDGHDEF